MVARHPLQVKISVRLGIPHPSIYRKGECKQETVNVATELSAAISSIKTGLADYNVSNLSTIWVAGLAVAAAPAIAWFAYRWVVRKANKAVFKGKL